MNGRHMINEKKKRKKKIKPPYWTYPKGRQFYKRFHWQTNELKKILTSYIEKMWESKAKIRVDMKTEWKSRENEKCFSLFCQQAQN